MASDLPPVPAWRVALFRADLDPTAKLVGLALAQFMDGAGRAQVSRSTLAEACGYSSVDPVKRAVRRLELAGLLGVVRAPAANRTPNAYRALQGGLTSTPWNGSRGCAGAPPAGGQGGLQRPLGGAGEHRELEGLEDQERALARDGQARGDEDRPAGPATAAEAAAAFRRALGARP